MSVHFMIQLLQLAFVRCWAIVAVVLCASWPLAAESQSLTRVLILYENQATLASTVEVAEGLRDSFRANMPPQAEIYSEYLDTVRFPNDEYEQQLAAYLISKYRGIDFSVIVAAGPGAVKFALRHRAQITADAPIIFGGVSDRSIQDYQLLPNVRGVVSHFDVRKTADLAFRLQPQANQITVMAGSSAFDKAWDATARTELADSYNGIPVNYVSGLSAEEFRQVAANLPRNSILLILSIFEDSKGRKFVPRDMAKDIATVSGAPAYGVYSTYLDGGVVGGNVGTFKSMGEQMGLLAAQAARGDMSGPRLSFAKDGPLLDWAQVTRWGLDPRSIPTDATILNHSLSAWEKYRTEILTLLAVILLQSVTIAALFVQRRRKQRLESELALERMELSYLSRTTQLGELSGALAHELNQPLTSILANAEAAKSLLFKDPIDLEELRAIVDDIILDDKRAANVITQLRSLMIRGESRLQPMDLNEAINKTLTLARSELLARQTRVDTLLDMPDIKISGNLAQLQQVVLNLLLNAADAMADLPSSKREISIETRNKSGGLCELVVTDCGSGVQPDRFQDLFKPFVSTKKSSLGLGLAICRSIVQAHGGTLQFDENIKRGARVILTLPSAKGGYDE